MEPLGGCPHRRWSDGVALTSIAHPDGDGSSDGQELSPDALETIEIDIPDEMPMVERVARAMLSEDLKRNAVVSSLSDHTRNAILDNSWQELVPFARAAIEAMQYPTKAMIDSAITIPSEPPFHMRDLDCTGKVFYSISNAYDVVNRWATMVKEALK